MSQNFENSLERAVSISTSAQLWPLLMEAVKTYLAARKTRKMIRNISPRLRQDAGLDHVDLEL